MKKELQEIQVLNESLEQKLEKMQDDIMSNRIDDINSIKALKNEIYQKTIKVFTYNLRQLIQLEATQKNLAAKIGVSEDMLSKYKSGEAFPTIETLIFISRVYNLDMDKLIHEPLSPQDFDIAESGRSIEGDIFDKAYYVYFFATNSGKEGKIHEGTIEIFNNSAVFKILSGDIVIKLFKGDYTVSDKMVFFNLSSSEDGNACINMMKPNINKSKYVGGVALMLLPSDANSKPCSQKILFSRNRIKRDAHYDELKQILSFNIEEKSFDKTKISLSENEEAFDFVSVLEE